MLTTPRSCDINLSIHLFIDSQALYQVGFMGSSAQPVSTKKRPALWLFGALGAIAPDIVLLYSKRWTMPSLTFDVWMYAGATALYLGLAAVVASIYPYGRNPSPWKAFALGVGLPVLISSLASLQHGTVISPRGEIIPGTFWDLLSLR